jgi:hypothetical protein
LLQDESWRLEKAAAMTKVFSADLRSSYIDRRWHRLPSVFRVSDTGGPARQSGRLSYLTTKVVTYDGQMYNGVAAALPMGGKSPIAMHISST